MKIHRIIYAFLAYMVIYFRWESFSSIYGKLPHLGPRFFFLLHSAEKSCRPTDKCRPERQCGERRKLGWLSVKGNLNKYILALYRGKMSLGEAHWVLFERHCCRWTFSSLCVIPKLVSLWSKWLIKLDRRPFLHNFCCYMSLVLITICHMFSLL